MFFNNENGEGENINKTNQFFIFVSPQKGTVLNKGPFMVDDWMQEEHQLHLLEGQRLCCCWRHHRMLQHCQWCRHRWHHVGSAIIGGAIIGNTIIGGTIVGGTIVGCAIIGSPIVGGIMLCQCGGIFLQFNLNIILFMAVVR